MVSLLLFEENWRPSKEGPHQSTFDADALRMAKTVKGDFSREHGEPLRSSIPNNGAKEVVWHRVTDAGMRSRSGYWAPVGYQYHRAARADLDRDGKIDLVEMVESSDSRALKITYGGKRPTRFVGRHKGKWVDQALVAAGPNAVLINNPESNLYFVYQRGSEMRAKFIGD